jgi:hypothetical protein
VLGTRQSVIAYDHDSTKRGIDFDGQSRQASSTSDGLQAGRAVTLGYRWRRAREFDTQSGVLTPEAQLGWAHEFTDVTPQASARFAVAPSAGSFSAPNWSVLPRVLTSYLTDPRNTTWTKFSRCSWCGITRAGTE